MMCLSSELLKVMTITLICSYSSFGLMSDRQCERYNEI